MTEWRRGSLFKPYYAIVRDRHGKDHVISFMVSKRFSQTPKGQAKHVALVQGFGQVRIIKLGRAHMTIGPDGYPVPKLPGS